MNEFNSRKQMLEAKIEDVEATLSELKTQLRAESEREQHAAIDKLDDYLGDLDNKFANLREFWTVLREEVRDMFSDKERNER